MSHYTVALIVTGPLLAFWLLHELSSAVIAHHKKRMRSWPSTGHGRTFFVDLRRFPEDRE